MLHILLLILKIIGIIIAVILGILVLLLGIVLFVPVRYEADASCDGTLKGMKARAEVTWLVHLVKATVNYRDQEFTWRLRIAWKTARGGQEAKETMKEEVGTYEEEMERISEDMEKESKEEKPEENHGQHTEIHEEISKEQKKDVEAPEEVEESEEGSKKGLEEAVDEAEETETEKSMGCGETTPGQSMEHSENSDQKGRKRLWQRVIEYYRKFIQKIRTVYEKIKCTSRNICDKIKALSEKTEEAAKKKDKIVELISDDVHKKAFLKVKDEVFRLLRKLKPKILEADVHYGFEDPYLTGQVLAVLGVLYPFIGENVNITPDFEQKVLEGELHIAGKIRVSYFVKLLWDLVWCKEVRMTYRNIRKLEL